MANLSSLVRASPNMKCRCKFFWPDERRRGYKTSFFDPRRAVWKGFGLSETCHFPAEFWRTLILQWCISMRKIETPEPGHATRTNLTCIQPNRGSSLPRMAAAGFPVPAGIKPSSNFSLSLVATANEVVFRRLDLPFDTRVCANKIGSVNIYNRLIEKMKIFQNWI